MYLGYSRMIVPPSADGSFSFRATNRDGARKPHGAEPGSGSCPSGSDSAVTFSPNFRQFDPWFGAAMLDSVEQHKHRNAIFPQKVRIEVCGKKQIVTCNAALSVAAFRPQLQPATVKR